MCIVQVLDSLNPGCQRLLFSATIASEREKINSVFKLPIGRSFFVSDLVQKGFEVTNLTHLKFECDPIPLPHILYHLLVTMEKSPFAGKSRGIIFVKSIQDAEVTRATLANLAVSCVALHSVQDRQVRSGSLEKFRAKAARVLVATDVACRGLDIPSVDWVINLNVPKVYSDYAHRAGRCARAGNPGTAITLVVQVLTGKDADKDVNTNRVTLLTPRATSRTPTQTNPLSNKQHSFTHIWSSDESD